MLFREKTNNNSNDEDESVVTFIRNAKSIQPSQDKIIEYLQQVYNEWINLLEVSPSSQHAELDESAVLGKLKELGNCETILSEVGVNDLHSFISFLNKARKVLSYYKLKVQEKEDMNDNIHFPTTMWFSDSEMYYLYIPHEYHQEKVGTLLVSSFQTVDNNNKSFVLYELTKSFPSVNTSHRLDHNKLSFEYMKQNLLSFRNCSIGFSNCHYYVFQVPTFSEEIIVESANVVVNKLVNYMINGGYSPEDCLVLHQKDAKDAITTPIDVDNNNDDSKALISTKLNQTKTNHPSDVILIDVDNDDDDVVSSSSAMNDNLGSYNNQI
jgi:hypothetical protein